MKNLKLFAVALLGAMTFGVTSCTDECKDVVCENNGTCVEGVCDCPEGFSGTTCEIEDKCITQDVECLNEGTCMDGLCDCAEGYEGDDCGTEERAKFISTYSVSEVCGSGSDSYQSTISTSSTEVTTILISNVYNLFDNNVVATVTDSDITISNQDPDNDGVTISGSGSINDAGTIVTITFTISDGTNTDSCTATYTKQ